MDWIDNPKSIGSGLICCIPQAGKCPVGCVDCFFNSGRSYLEPLEDNLPHIPTPDMARGRIVRMNDGSDSNVQRHSVEKVGKSFDDAFYNTSMPIRLEEFPGPVVLTVNPGDMTDTDFHKLETTPNNLMFVRVRVNEWNNYVVEQVVEYYTGLYVPVVLTFMAYYENPPPEKYIYAYEWTTRTKNNYWVITDVAREYHEDQYRDNPLVYSCGYKGTHSCSLCGNCIREYYVVKEQLRND